MGLIEHHIRQDLNKTAPRVMAVLNPIKVVIENFDEAAVEHFSATINPEDPEAGTVDIPFTRELYIERDDLCRSTEKILPPCTWS